MKQKTIESGNQEDRKELAEGSITIGDDALFAAQLTEQMTKARAGEIEIVKAGAMMLKLKEMINLSACGQVSGGRGKKGGFEDWLRTYAADVSHSCAYRYMGVARAVQRRCQIDAASELERLLSVPAKSLPKKDVAKQLELFEAIEGKSQRELLAGEKPEMSPPGLTFEEEASIRIVAIAKRLAVEFYAKKGPVLLWTHLGKSDKKLLWDIVHQIALDVKKGMAE